MYFAAKKQKQKNNNIKTISLFISAANMSALILQRGLLWWGNPEVRFAIQTSD